MDERWQQIERIYHAARELGKSARAEFLSIACAGGEEISSHELPGRKRVTELRLFGGPIAGGGGDTAAFAGIPFTATFMF